MNSRVITGLLAVSVLLCPALTGTIASTVFTVGGDREWIVPSSDLNYTVWAQNITARVGDSLYFKYNPNGHNVLKVNSTVYEACGTTIADHLSSWDTGDTTVVLQEAGTHYFMCGAPSHCATFHQAFSIDVAPVKSDTPPGSTTSDVLSPPGNAAQPINVVHSWVMAFVSTVVLMSAFREVLE